MKPLLFLALCISAYAVPPVPALPPVTRRAPLLSPRAASAPKATPMFVPASVNPPIPMMIDWMPAPGGVTLIVDAFKPANTPMIFEYSTSVTGPWEYLMGWGPYPEAQWVGVAWTTYDLKFIRATHTAPPEFAVASSGLHVVKLPPSKTKSLRLK